MGTLTLEQRYLEAVRRLRTRTDGLEEMAIWKEDLASRLWRMDMALKVRGASLYDVEAFVLEVEMFNAVAEAFNKRDTSSD